ncbi:MAG: tetratricopeptide repeat protein [Caldilineaceae bacterium]
MSHPFGDLISQHLHRKHGLSQAKLAEGILQDPAIIGKMCRGQRLNGPQARERVVSIIAWLRQQTVLTTVDEANGLLAAAGMAALRMTEPTEAQLLQQLNARSPTPTLPIMPRVPVTTTPRTNLPASLTSFVGRAEAMMEVAQFIATHRLVTLTGAGGVGKTRLALETARTIVESREPASALFPDGVWLVELAALSVDEAATTVVAQALFQRFKLTEQDSRSPLEALHEYFANKHLLLVLDNCEHLVDGCAEVCASLLQQCWHLHILTTSREELRIPGEVLYPVPPLALPAPSENDASDVLTCASAQLFVDRMRSTQPGLTIQPNEIPHLAHICRQLDGIPLAVELAAPLARTLALAEIAQQLDSQMAGLTNRYRTAIPRHQTMYSALVWSYQLLSAEEQRWLACMAVFAGGWTLEAAQAIGLDETSSTVTPATVALLLAQLSAKSWVLIETVNDQRRYRLLEPVRQFAHTQLGAGEGVGGNRSTTVQQRHLRYYLALAETIAPRLRVGPQVAQGYAELDVEHDNLRAAINWALRSGEVTFAARIVTALYEFWSARGYLQEGLTQAERVLAARLNLAATEQAHLLLTAGGIAIHQHNYPVAHPLLVESEALARPLGSSAYFILARTCLELSWTMIGLLDFAAAQRYGQEGLALAQTIADPWLRGEALIVLGAVAQEQGDHATAHRHLTAAVACTRLLEDTPVYGNALCGLGMLLVDQGDYPAAHNYLQQSATIFERLGNQAALAWSLLGLGEIAAAQGHSAEAEQHYRQALALQRAVQDMDHAGMALLALGQLAQAQGDYGQAQALLHESLTIAIEIGHRPTIVQTLQAISALATAQGQTARAARIFGAVEGALQKEPLLLKPFLHALHKRTGAILCDQLGETVFARAWTEGAAMTLKKVVEYALVAP